MPNNYIQAPLGIRINFNNGAQVSFPKGERVFHLRVVSKSNGVAVFDGEVQSLAEKPVTFQSAQTYYVPWSIEITQAGQRVIAYDLNLTGRPVCLDMRGCTLREAIAWMDPVAVFQTFYNCRLTVLMPAEGIELFQDVYPKFSFITLMSFQAEEYFAVIPVGNWGNGDLNHNPTDPQKDNVIEHAERILGVKTDRKPPLLADALKDCKATYGKYVCIATRGARKMNQWTGEGWTQVVAFLKEKGYKVCCVDGDRGDVPAGAELPAETKTLRGRVDLIRGCEFLVGVDNDSSWLAWGCEKPVVLIANCTNNGFEFNTPYRVDNDTVCHGCFHRCEAKAIAEDSCPENRDFVCMRSITAEKVIETIKRIPESNGSVTKP